MVCAIRSYKSITKVTQEIMKINKNYPFTHAFDSFLKAVDRECQPIDWLFPEDPVESVNSPDYKVFEKEEVYEVRFLLPGFDRKELAVSLQGSNLTVSASCEETDSSAGFGKSSFSHTIEVPDSCEKEKVTAKLESGILKVVLPKRKKPKAVQVKIC